MAYTNGGQHALMPPRRMSKPELPSGTVPTGKTSPSGKPLMRKATWWDHTGPLAVVFAGGPDSGAGDLVLPVRMPQQPGQYARVEHFLSTPGRWHKVDLVRRRKAGAPGGWVYEAQPKAVTVPGGARAARSNGVPKQAYRRDRLSAGYRELRTRQAEHAASIAEHRRHRARSVARDIIAVHGAVLVAEDCDIRSWYRLWGKRLSRTTPGLLIAALDRECRAAGGRLVRASTWSTALSQHCLCGERVNKTLRDREHKCIACGLVGKRDLVSAALAAFVRLTDVDDPKTAYLDTTMSRHAQIIFSTGLEEALCESTAASQNTSRGAGHVAVPPQRGTSAHRTAGKRPRATPDDTRTVRDHAGKPGCRPGCNPQLTFGDLRIKS
ncbi:hypothetical protein ACGFYQ_03675 [Streptomyces sp. NPDC048258]|uniref:zinc ribbon domain-containing protein n=1 Tax=Streptomyces sp. NPDC048258 TaxID=3365527 RepID=UPI00371D3C80